VIEDFEAITVPHPFWENVPRLMVQKPFPRHINFAVLPPCKITSRVAQLEDVAQLDDLLRVKIRRFVLTSSRYPYYREVTETDRYSI